jgi:hypothetical protein
MSRDFTTSGAQLSAASLAIPSAMTVLAWIKDADYGSANVRCVFAHRTSGANSSISFSATTQILNIRKDHATTVGFWNVSDAAINAVVSARTTTWVCLGISLNSSSVLNIPRVFIGDENTPMTEVAVTTTTVPAGLVTTASHVPAWGNTALASSGYFRGLIGPVAYHDAVLASEQIEAWRQSYSPVISNCLLSYAMDTSSPAEDLSTNNRDGTYDGTVPHSTDDPVVGGPAYDESALFQQMRRR